MKKYILLVTCASIMAPKLYAPIGGGSGGAGISLATSDAELKAQLQESLDAKDSFITKANKAIYGFIDQSVSHMQDSTQAFDGLIEKMNNTIKILRDAMEAKDALARSQDLLQLKRSIDNQIIQHIQDYLEDLYKPLATSALITDATSKNRINSAVDILEQNLELLKKAIPTTFKRAIGTGIKSALKEAGSTLAQVGITAGVDALVQLITGKRNLSDEEKGQIIAAVKANFKIIDDVKESFNLGAMGASQEVQKLKNLIDPETISTVKETFKIFTDPTFVTAPVQVKFSSVVNGIKVLVDTNKTLGQALKSIDNGLIKFASTVLGEEPDEKLSLLQNTASKLSKTIDKLSSTYDDLIAAIEEANEKYAKQVPQAPTKPISTPSYQPPVTQPTYPSYQPTQPVSPYPGYQQPVQPSPYQPAYQAPTKPTKVYNEFGTEITNPISGRTYYTSPDPNTRQQIVW
jgi:uncharacterized protein YukE